MIRASTHFSTAPFRVNYVQDIVRDEHHAPRDQRVKEVGGASGQRPEEVQEAARARQNSDGAVDFSMTRPEQLSPPGGIPLEHRGGCMYSVPHHGGIPRHLQQASTRATYHIGGRSQKDMIRQPSSTQTASLLPHTQVHGSPCTLPTPTC